MSAMMDNLLYQLSVWFYPSGLYFLVVIVALFWMFLLKYNYQSKLNLLLQDSPLAMLVIDEASGELLLSNRPAMQLLGIRLVGKSHLFPLAMDTDTFLNGLKQVSGLYFKNILQSWAISESQTIKVELTGRKTRYNNRRAWMVYVTEYKEPVNEGEQVKASLRIARTAFDSLSELIYIKDNNGKILDTNRAFDHFWNHRFEEGSVTVKGVMQSRSNQRRWTTDPQGRSCLLETSQTPLLSSDGDTLGTLGISHDVTDWFKMQQNLRDEMDKRKGTEIALAQREIILQSILESSPDVIALFNENFIYEACNQAYVESIGLDMEPEQLVGKYLRDVLPARLADRFADTDHQVLRQGISLRHIDEIIDENGKHKWFDVVKSPYKDPSSGVNGILLLARDVTERYVAEMKLEEMNEQLERLSFLDGLTQVANRRRFDEQLETMWNLHRRQKTALTVMLCDIDFFKDYNDNYGHLKGDQALVEVAQAFTNVLTRSSDCVARYGGEEFAFILPNTDHNGAKIIANNVHQVIHDLAIEHGFSNVSEHLTVSLGVASYVPMFGDTIEQIIAHADSALYAAKKSGRNRTQYYYQ